MMTGISAWTRDEPVHINPAMIATVAVHLDEEGNVSGCTISMANGIMMIFLSLTPEEFMHQMYKGLN